MTKPMKTVDLPSGHVGHSPKHVHIDHNPHHTPGPTPDPTVPPVSGTATLTKARTMNAPDHGKKAKLTPEEFLAGKTPNSGKLHKDGTPVAGQDAAHDAERAAERAAEAAGEVEVPEPPEATDPPVVPDPTATPAPKAF